MKQLPSSENNKLSVFARKALAGYLAYTMAFPWQVLAAPPVPAGTTNTTVTQANATVNVTVVNIAAPNASGLSHNQYTSYDVDKNGLILNNATGVQQSVLAGTIQGNSNLNGVAAKLILNEVVAPNPSLLQGYQEVHGQAAEVVVANPYGITCNGCGFINTPRATLTTGVPTLDTNGNLTGFAVRQGEITIQDYLDAYDISAFDLVARSAKIDGNIYAKNLRIALGANQFDYATGNVTPITGSGAVPLYALDSSALGGMYADRIRLVATEAGVGVRMLGDMAADVDDIQVDASGKIEFGNAVVANRDIQVVSNSQDGIVSSASAQLVANQNINIDLNAGGVEHFGTIYAGGNLDITGAGSSLQSLINEGEIFAEGDITVAGLPSIYNRTGKMMQAGGALGISSASLISNDGWMEGATFSMSGAQFSNTGTLIADAIAPSSSTMQFSNRVANSGTIYTVGNLAISAPVVENTGTLISEATLSVTSPSFTSSGDIDATDLSIRASNGAVSLTGQTLAQHDMTINASGSVTFGNGDVYAGNNFSLSAWSLIDNGVATWNTSVSPAVQTSPLRAAGYDLSVTLGGGGFNVNQGQTWDAGHDLMVSATGFHIGDSAYDLISTVSAENLLSLKATGTTGSGIGSRASVVSSQDILIDTNHESFTVSAVTPVNGIEPYGIQAGDDITLKVRTLGVNGPLVAGGDVDVQVDNGNNVSLSGSGKVYSGGVFRFKNADGSRAGNLNLAAGSQLLAGQFDILADTLNLGYDDATLTYGRLEGSGVVDSFSAIDVNALLIQRDYIRLLLSTGGYSTTLNIHGDLDNYGLIYSSGTTTNINVDGNIINRPGAAVAYGGYSSTGSFGISLLGNGKHFDNYGYLNGGAGVLGINLYNLNQSVINHRYSYTNSHGQLVFDNGVISANSLKIYSSGSSPTGSAPAGTYANAFINHGMVKGNDIWISVPQFINRPEVEPSVVDVFTAVRDFTNPWRWSYDPSTGGYVVDNTNCLATACANNMLSYRYDAWVADGKGGTVFTDRITGQQVYVWGTIAPDGKIYSAPAMSGSWCPPGLTCNFIGSARGYNMYGSADVYADWVDTRVWGQDFAPGTDMFSPTVAANNSLKLTIKNALNHGGTLQSGGVIELYPYVAGDDVRANLTTTDIIAREGAYSFINETISAQLHTDVNVGRTKYVCWNGASYTCSGGTIQGFDGDNNFNPDETNQIWLWPSQTTVTTRSIGGIIKASLFDTAPSNGQGTPFPGSVVNQTPGAATTTSLEDPASATAALLQGSTTRTPANDPGALTPPSTNVIDALSLGLPVGQNGEFVLSSSPSSRYLIETNPLYTSLENPGLGSDYLMQYLGLNPDNQLLRLGDNAYENYLIKEQIRAQTGISLIRSAYSDAEQIQMLYDNSVLAASSMKLSFGVALTAEQVKDLKQDIIWMVEQEVNGKKVLAPVVYLTDATRIATQGNGDARIIAQNAVIRADSFLNKNATVDVDNTLVIATRDDLVNAAGTISAKRMRLSSERGDIVNSSATRNVGGADNWSTKVDRVGSIYASEVLDVDAGRDVVLDGAQMGGGLLARVKAGRDVNVNALVLESRQSSTTESRSLTSYEKFTSTRMQQTAFASGITSGEGSVVVQAGNDVNITGSNIEAKENVILTAENGNVNIKTQQLESNWTRSNERTGLFINAQADAGSRARGDEDPTGPSAGVFTGIENSKSSSSGQAISNAASQIKAGNVVLAQSKRGDVNITGSEISGDGGVVLDAANNLNLMAANNTDSSQYQSESHQVGVYAEANGDGAFTGLRARGSKVEGSEQNSVAQTNRITSGNGTVLLKAGKDVTSEGSDITGKNVVVDAENLNLLAARDEHSRTEKGESYEVSIGAGVTTNGMGQSVADLANGKKGATLVIATPENQLRIGGQGETHDDKSTNTHARVNTLKATDGSIVMNVRNKISDEGTQFDAAQNIVMLAQTYEGKAAQDTSSSESHSTNANAMVTVGVNAMSEVTATVAAGGGSSNSKESSSKAVVGNFKAGGNIITDVKGKASFEGTNFDAGGNVVLKAGEKLEIKQANNTYTSSADSQQGGVNVSASVCADLSCASASVGANGATSNSQESTRIGVASNIKGRNVVLAGADGITLQGTNIDAKQDVAILGKLDYQALTSETSRTGKSDSAGVNLGGSVGTSNKALDGTGGLNTNVQFDTSRDNYKAVNKQGGSINAGGNVSFISSDKGRLEGTSVNAKSMYIEGKGLAFESAQSTEFQDSSKVSANIGVGGGKDAGSGDGSGGAGGGKSFNASVGFSVNNDSKDNIGNQIVKIRTTDGTTLNLDGDLTGAGQIKGGVSGSVQNLKLTSVTDQVKESHTSVGGYLGLAEVNTGGSGDKPANRGEKIDAIQGKTLNAAGHVGGTGAYVNVDSSTVDSTSIKNRAGFDDAKSLTVRGDASLTSADLGGARVLGTTSSTELATHSRESNTEFTIRGTVTSAMGFDQGRGLEVNGNLFKAGGNSNQGAPDATSTPTRPRSNADAPRPVGLAGGADAPVTRPRSNADAPKPVGLGGGGDAVVTRPRSNADAPMPTRPRPIAEGTKPFVDSARLSMAGDFSDIRGGGSRTEPGARAFTGDEVLAANRAADVGPLVTHEAAHVSQQREAIKPGGDMSRSLRDGDFSSVRGSDARPDLDVTSHDIVVPIHVEELVAVKAKPIEVRAADTLEGKKPVSGNTSEPDGYGAFENTGNPGLQPLTRPRSNADAPKPVGFVAAADGSATRPSSNADAPQISTRPRSNADAPRPTQLPGLADTTIPRSRAGSDAQADVTKRPAAGADASWVAARLNGRPRNSNSEAANLHRPASADAQSDANGTQPAADGNRWVAATRPDRARNEDALSLPTTSADGVGVTSNSEAPARPNGAEVAPAKPVVAETTKIPATSTAADSPVIADLASRLRPIGDDGHGRVRYKDEASGLILKSMPDSYKGEENNTSVAQMSLHPEWAQKGGVKYLNPAEQAAHELVINDKGLLVHKQTGQLFSTADKTDGAIFVIDANGRIFAGAANEQGKFHHSSLTGGQPVAMAGHIMVQDGKLLHINNNSGHYQPDSELLHQAVNLLQDKKLDMSATRILEIRTSADGRPELFDHKKNAVVVINPDDPRSDPRNEDAKLAVEMRLGKSVDYLKTDGKRQYYQTEVDGIKLTLKGIGAEYVGESLNQSHAQEVGGHVADWAPKGGVKYLTPQEQDARELVINKDGLLINKQTGKPFSTGDRLDGAIFVIDGNGRIFASTEDERGKFHHSSLAAGQPVAAAGHMIVENGKLLHINNNSGHYQPDADQFYAAGSLLKARGIDDSQTRLMVNMPDANGNMVWFDHKQNAVVNFDDGDPRVADLALATQLRLQKPVQVTGWDAEGRTQFKTELNGQPLILKGVDQAYVGEDLNLAHAQTVGKHREVWAGMDGVKYLTPQERDAAELVVNAQGLLVNKLTGKPFSSGDKSDGAIFVIDANGRIYASTDNKPGHFHHSSFTGGEPVAMAGHLVVQDGLLLHMNNDSGHYQPDLDMFKQGVKILEDKKANIKEMNILIVSKDEKGRVHFFDTHLQKYVDPDKNPMQDDVERAKQRMTTRAPAAVAAGTAANDPQFDQARVVNGN